MSTARNAESSERSNPRPVLDTLHFDFDLFCMAGEINLRPGACITTYRPPQVWNVA